MFCHCAASHNSACNGGGRSIWGTAGAVAAIVFSPEPDIPPPVIITEVVQADPGAAAETRVEDRRIEIPDVPGFGAAQWSFRGEADRDGFNGDRDGKSSRSGVETLEGYYWRFPTNQRVDASPAVRGSSVMVGSANQTFYSIDVTSGRPLWTNDTDGAINSSASYAFAPLGRPVQEVIVAGGVENLVRAGIK